MAPPIFGSSHFGKYPKLIIRSVTSNSEDALSGEKYELGEVSILFPFTKILRHIRPFKRLVDYETRQNIELCEAGVVIYSSDSIILSFLLLQINIEFFPCIP